MFLSFLFFLSPFRLHTKCYFETHISKMFIKLTLFHSQSLTYIDIIPIFVDNQYTTNL